MSLTDIEAYLGDHNGEARRGSERGIIIACTSNLDNLLGKLLSLCRSGAAKRGQTFASRIDAASKLGLITDAERAKLHKIRELRNYVGHEVGISLQTPDRLALCEQIFEGVSVPGVSSKQIAAAGKVSLVANALGAALLVRINSHQSSAPARAPRA